MARELDREEVVVRGLPRLLEFQSYFSNGPVAQVARARP
jgi:hypothetical protein